MEETTLVAKLAKMGQFKTIVLTHMYPICNGREKELPDLSEKSQEQK